MAITTLALLHMAGWSPLRKRTRPLPVETQSGDAAFNPLQPPLAIEKLS